MVLDFLALSEAPPKTIRKLFEEYLILELLREGSQNNCSIFDRFGQRAILGTHRDLKRIVLSFVRVTIIAHLVTIAPCWHALESERRSLHLS